MALTKITPEIVAVNAIQGTLIADNAITAVHIATNAVSGVLIADNAVTATHIAQNVITVTQLADDAVEADKIADGVITTNHLNSAMISSQTQVTAATGDFLLIGDTSDSNNLKKVPVSGVTGLVSAPITALNNATANELVTIGSTTTELDAESGLTFDGNSLAITSSSATDNLIITSTDAAGSTPAPDLVLYRNSASPADGDDTGRIEFRNRNDNSQDFIAATISTWSDDVSDGTEDASMGLYTMMNGTLRNQIWMDSTSHIINASNQDVNFIVESVGNANMLFVDSGNNRVGINAGTTPLRELDARDGDGVTSLGVGNNAAYILRSQDGTHGPTLVMECSDGSLDSRTNSASGDSMGLIKFRGYHTNGGYEGARIEAKITGTNGTSDMPSDLIFSTSANGSSTPTERMRIAHTGNITFDSFSYDVASDLMTINNGLYLSSGYIRSGAADFGMGTASQGSIMNLSNTNGNLVFSAVGDASGTGTITHHTNNWMYFRGGSEGAFYASGDFTGNIKLASGANDHVWELSSGAAMTIAGSTRVLSGDFNDTSDLALKENVTDITGGLSVIKNLRPRNFDWKEEGKIDGASGFIAQEVATVLPNEVQGTDYSAGVTDENGVKTGVSMGKTIKLSGIVAHLTKAVQELEARLAALEE